MLIATLSALLATAVTGAAEPAPAARQPQALARQPQALARQPQALACVVALRTAAETMRTSQGDSADARSLTLSASAAEERYRRQAEADGLNPIQIEIVLAAERDSHRAASPEQLRSCLAQKTAGLGR